ncbi:MAG: molybdopterin-dependent oxidoreductase [Proteobacteria bacterium]|nr:molybdopterin oxidoreductase [Pseudomonadota bacterium]NOG59605.1 molybdopterin-dependent oxidoreductase [Pseudomonadota bacterium]
MQTKPKETCPDIKKVSTYCYQCVNGPDLLTVEVIDGVATKVEPNFDLKGEHPADGKICVKPFGLVQKLYNPHRLKKPMKRTNPKKGRNEDPGWVEIEWNEALDIVAEKMNAARAKGIQDENGNPRLAFTTGGAATPFKYMGSFPALLFAWGPFDQSLGAGGTVKCYHAEHMFGELWHRAFTILPDTPRCEYIISFGNNIDASGGVTGVRRHADARKRGMKRIQFEPHLSITGANATEWVPIKTKTDSAVLFSMVHVLLHEHSIDELDYEFLRDRTASAYLVGPNGFYLRDPESKKPLLWDNKSNKAVPYDTPDTDPAIVGNFTVTNAVEIGADDENWVYENIQADTGLEKAKQLVAERTPEWASEISDVPAETIRRVTNEYLSHAHIGETETIDGREIPFRPVATVLGKSVNNGWGGYECVWAHTMMQVLVGALEVSGGMLGSTTHLAGDTDWDRTLTVDIGEDGFMSHTFTPTSKEEWNDAPINRHAQDCLTPMAGKNMGAQLFGSTTLAWLRLQERAAESWKKPNPPDVWFVYKCNPAISFSETDKMNDIMATFPFIAAFAYTFDETNHYADVLMPEATDLESDQVLRIGGGHYFENHWESEGWALRQAVVPPQNDAKDFSWIANELARRTGLLEAYNSVINGAGCGIPLQGEGYDYSLDITKENSQEEIWDAVCKAATHDLTEGKEVHGLDWFREHGYKTRPYSRLNWYLHPLIEDKKLRYELPYQERYFRMGKELANRLHETGVHWWDRQLAEYQPLPIWHDLNKLWDELIEKNHNVKAADYPYWLLTGRSMQYAWGANVGIQMMKEVADNVFGHDGIIMNAGKAEELGINDGDEIEVTSPIASTRGIARLRQGVRPDTIVMIAQFGQWKTPFAKDLKRTGVNKLVPMNQDYIDGGGSSIDGTKVYITRVGAA